MPARLLRLGWAVRRSPRTAACWQVNLALLKQLQPLEGRAAGWTPASWYHRRVLANLQLPFSRSSRRLELQLREC